MHKSVMQVNAADQGCILVSFFRFFLTLYNKVSFVNIS